MMIAYDDIMMMMMIRQTGSRIGSPSFASRSASSAVIHSQVHNPNLMMTVMMMMMLNMMMMTVMIFFAIDIIITIIVSIIIIIDTDIVLKDIFSPVGFITP